MQRGPSCPSPGLTAQASPSLVSAPSALEISPPVLAEGAARGPLPVVGSLGCCLPSVAQWWPRFVSLRKMLVVGSAGRVLSTPGGPGSTIKTSMEPRVPLHPYGVLCSMGNGGIGLSHTCPRPPMGSHGLGRWSSAPRRPTCSFGSHLWSPAGVLLPSQAASPPGGAFSRAQLATSGLLFAV